MSRAVPISAPLVQSIALIIWTAVLSSGPHSAQAVEEQHIELKDPGWHFVAFQIQPEPSSPQSVFGESGYDHLWAFDPERGWAYYTPLQSQEAAQARHLIMNDLISIEAFRGYWIHVLTAPLNVTVSGERPRVVDLAQPGWHALGIFGDEGSAGDAFPYLAALDEPSMSLISEIWAFDGAQFQPRFRAANPDTNCGAPKCFEKGKAYWLKTTARVLFGQSFDVSTDCIVIPDNGEMARLDISFGGVGPAGAKLTSTEAPVRFVPPRALDGVRGSSVPLPDTARASAAGPAADVSVCGDTSCAGLDASHCIDICFANPGEETYSLFVGLPSQEGAPAGRYSSCDEPYTTLVLQSRGSAGMPPIEHRIDVALSPRVLDGEYTGFLSYGAGAADEGIPLRMIIECAMTESDQSGTCNSGRFVGVINPVVRTTHGNALDDDGDGDIDEPGEAQNLSVPRRDAPSFPQQTILHGQISSGGDSVRMATSFSPYKLEFASNPTLDRQAGIATLAAGTRRELTLDGVRRKSGQLVGLFSERYVEVNGESRMNTGGTFRLTRVRGPQCVAHDHPESSASPASGLEIPCGDHNDCPSRCIYNARPTGFRCRAGEDPKEQCPEICGDGELQPCEPGQVGMKATECRPYECRFFDLAGDFDDASTYEPASLRMSGQVPPVASDGAALTIEVMGSGISRRFFVGKPGASVSCGGTTCPAGSVCDGGICRTPLADLPCGIYIVRYTVDGCLPIERRVCWCTEGICLGGQVSFDIDLSALDCREGVCRANRAACSTDAHCPKTCDVGGGICDGNADCPTIHRCCAPQPITGILRCTGSCTPRNPACPVGTGSCTERPTSCNSTTCVERPTKMCASDGAACDAGADCRRCSAGGEATACSADSDCPTLPGHCIFSGASCEHLFDCPQLDICQGFRQIKCESHACLEFPRSLTAGTPWIVAGTGEQAIRLSLVPTLIAPNHCQTESPPQSCDPNNDTFFTAIAGESFVGGLTSGLEFTRDLRNFEGVKYAESGAASFLWAPPPGLAEARP